MIVNKFTLFTRAVRKIALGLTNSWCKSHEKFWHICNNLCKFTALLLLTIFEYEFVHGKGLNSCQLSCFMGCISSNLLIDWYQTKYERSKAISEKA